ncbi:glycosyltransferase family 2 protein [Nocardioides piscis]|uniref:Glycosyltransferase family 2 protein n=1 Tax=Nocardioides piscis TaxID=2714938 RepID=A0A6G7YD08_9ACTN|nr:galactosyltransferase-related protein [Nocardioides piscis]QIK74609.1 glycosyltransferase family 2 protein [Nocardioides piscis]
MRTAVVTVAHGRHDHLACQRESLAAATVPPDHHVVVAIDDPVLAGSGRCSASLPATPLGLPLAAARNLGARIALGLGAGVLVFLDVDCLAGPGLVEAYADAVESDPSTVWSGPVTYLDPPPGTGYDLAALPGLDSPHPARPAPAPGERLHDADPDLFWSLSFACSAAAWRRSGGFCEDYVGYGGEDTDFGRVLVEDGLELGWLGAARAYHQFHPVSRPPVEHVDDIVRNAAIFRRRWGHTPMLGWLREFERLGLVKVDEDGRWHTLG